LFQDVLTDLYFEWL